MSQARTGVHNSTPLLDSKTYTHGNSQQEFHPAQMRMHTLGHTQARAQTDAHAHTNACAQEHKHEHKYASRTEK